MPDTISSECACMLALAISASYYVYTPLDYYLCHFWNSHVHLRKDYAGLLAEVRNANIGQKRQYWFLPIKVISNKQLEKEFPWTQVCFI